MTTRADHLRTLSQICRQFGGQLVIVTQSEFEALFEASRDVPNRDVDGLSEASFTDAHGIHWRDKIVYAVRGREQIRAIIHEMGHIFAAIHPPDYEHPQEHWSDECLDCHEWHWFGWEIALARHIGATRVWCQGNAYYQTTKGPWEELTSSQRRTIVINRLAHAKKLGLLGEDNFPRNRR